MTAFQRLSTGPTLPDLIRKEADRRAQRSLHMLPADVWRRPATAAVFWHHRNNGLVQRSGGYGGKPGTARLDGGPDQVRPRSKDATPGHCPARMRARAIARSSRAAQAGPSAHASRSWQYQTGMAACFTGASGVLAAARLLNRCRLLSPDGLGAAFKSADRLTRAGMRLWRSSRASRPT